VFEGELRLHTGGEVHELQPQDCIWLHAGTELVYEAELALVHFAIHPSNWHEGS
jgi:ethanolamine utilization protein EutQ